MEPQLVIGLGTGQCGFGQLLDLLKRQPQSRVTLEDRPLLPWKSSNATELFRERLKRWRENSSGYRFVGDIAAFYLPYVETALQLDSSVRFLCLQQEKQRVVEGFEDHLHRATRLPTNHWAMRPPTGWYHDPVWSRTFPQFDTPLRPEGIERYWDQYQEAAAEFSEKYPDNFRVWNQKDLSDPAQVEGMLDYIGIPKHLQLVHLAAIEKPLTAQKETRVPLDPMDPRRCVVLVPFGFFIHQDCDQPLKELERRGYQVRRVGGYAAIDQGRNQMATDALLDGFEETLWIDSDVGFHPDDVEKLRRHNLPISCGLYPQKGKRALACHVGVNLPKLTFGAEGGLHEILYAGAGFLHIRRQVYLDVQSRMDVPIANERFGAPMIPFFFPMIREIEDGHWYLAEDYAFCERARRSGYQVVADSSIRLWHVGNYRYGWEDAGMERPRFATFTMNFRDIRSATTQSNEDLSHQLENLANQFPWPGSPPTSETVVPDREWMPAAARQALADTVKTDFKLLVETGGGVGRITRYLADLAPHSHVLAIDAWSPDKQENDEPSIAALRPQFFDCFLSECWDYRERITPVRLTPEIGLRLIAESGLMPDVIFIDPTAAAEGLDTLLQVALESFPSATLIGHRLDEQNVAPTVEAICNQAKRRLETLGSAWRVLPR